MSKREDCIFGLHFDLHLVMEDTVIGADITEANINELLQKAKPEYVTYDCKGHTGIAGYDTKIGIAQPNMQKDSLAIWRKATKAHGVRLGVHYSGVQDFIQVKNHSEYACISKDGTSDGATTSTFGNYVDEILIPQLKEVVGKYDIDSVWLDGECWGAMLDYSPKAATKWRELTGDTYPPTSKNEPNWNAFKAFNRKQFDSYLCHWVEEMHKFKPQLCCTSNWAYTTMMPIPPKAGVTMISGDYDPMLSVDRARTECRYLQNTGLPWELMSWGFDLVENQFECHKMPAQLMQEAGVVVMHGGAFMIYYLPTRAGFINNDIIETAAKISEFILSRRDFSFKSTSIPQVAILHSSEAQLDRSDKVYAWWGTPLNELEGVLHAMIELHYSCNVCSEYQLADCINTYPYIIVPDTHKLTEEFIKLLLRYVEDGGSLFLCGLHCAKLFEDYIGVVLSGEQYVSTSIGIDGHKISANGVWDSPQPVDTDVLVYRYVGLEQLERSSYLDIRENDVNSTTKKYIEKHPAVTSRKFGKGKIAVAYGPLASLYYDNHHPFLRDVFKKVAEELMPNPMVSVKAPSNVELSLRKTNTSELCVHMLNTLNMPVAKNRAFSDYIPCVRDIEVSVLTTEKPKKVVLEPEGKELDFVFENGVTTVFVDSLHIHSAVIFKEICD